jgi:hypothetical protein
MTRPRLPPIFRYSLKFDAKSDKFNPCFFAARANSLAESNSELSSPTVITKWEGNGGGMKN